jgi:acyl-CoA synthetase (AMP-forming)/AMP-acid ligase II
MPAKARAPRGRAAHRLRDAAGEYWFAGRIKQIIERNSENITPGEIEQALYRHPAVSEAGAFGVADEAEGQVPIAYVSFAPGTRASEDELKAFLATQIANFGIVVGIALLLSGFGFGILAAGGALRSRESVLFGKKTAEKPVSTTAVSA